MPETTKATLTVAVLNIKKEPTPDALVKASRIQPAAQSAALHYDKALGAYRAFNLPAGAYRVSVEAPGCDPQEREVQVGLGGAKEIFIVGKKGLPFLYRGSVKVPFEPQALVGVELERDADDSDAGLAAGPARGLSLAVEPVHPQIRRQKVAVFRLDARSGDVGGVLAQLNAAKGVRRAGLVVELNRETVSFLTNELVVKFKAHVTPGQAEEIAKRHGLEILRQLPQAGNAFLMRAAVPASRELLAVMEEVAASGVTEYVEPNLFSTAADDAITPNDYLFPLQWHLPTAHVPDAWQQLHDNLGANTTHGDPGVIIAIMDSGVDTTNPDFTGNVTSGQPKVYQLYDFVNMVANNTSLGGSHGTCCAGIATAVANNTEGAAGAAGNCRLMGLRRNGPEATYSDAYLWAAGFDPVAPGFPAQITPGADIISNSFGYSVGLPISGLMKDTFDFLTTYGRGGRGVLLFFSVGNVIPPIDFTTYRPWAAYEKTLAIGASSIDNDGVTEIHADYSDFSGPTSVLDVCAPSQDTYVGGVAVYNPHTTYATVTDDIVGQGNTPQHATTATALTAAAAAAATSLTVASSAGFAVGARVLVDTGIPNAEMVQVTGVPNGTHINVTATQKAHAVGAGVATGPANCTNGFGGTSSATPLTAGIAALVLSAKPDLTWMQVRQILRETADHIQPANTDPVGIWTDAAGVSFGSPGYAGPHYSRWYGFGRVNAEAAVQTAINYSITRDVVVRDNLADVGAMPSAGAFWASPDLWVRNADPALDPGAVPAAYATAGPHQDVVSGVDNYVYVRLKNVGLDPSSDFYVRVYLAHWPGLEFVYPDNFIPTNNPGLPVPSPMTPGTYLLGEVHHDAMAGGAMDTVHITWPSAMIPPQTVVVAGATVHWHPCILAEVSPQDGPDPAGPHVWDNNNLCQRNVTVSYADNADRAVASLIAGNLRNESAYLMLRVDRSHVPAGVEVYLQVVDRRATARLKRLVEAGFIEAGSPPTEIVFLQPSRVSLEQEGGGTSVLTLPAQGRLALGSRVIRYSPQRNGFVLDKYRGRDVVRLATRGKALIPVLAGPGAQVPILIAAVGKRGQRPASFLLPVEQLDASGKLSGAAAVEIRVG
ncbi:MAG: S8 family serine peptidase [Acidobacteria bacterium]|nr:S8 family serine peptidase [Acidobacteriota bacterium]